MEVSGLNTVTVFGARQLVEDDKHFYNLLAALFENINKKSRVQYSLDWVVDAAGISETALDDADAVLLDYNLGEETTGLDILKQAGERGCRTPIIFLTGEDGRDIFREARKNGAAGYLIKQEIVKAPFTLDAVVHFAVENAQQRERLRQMASLDGLTGVLNHGEMQRRLDAEIARANRTGNPLSLILMDIDHFKQINDTYGHPAGDDVLKWLADKLKQTCRKSDIVARYGGEEFLIILPETDEQGSVQKAEKLRREIASMSFRNDGGSISVTSSFGVSGHRVGDSKQVLVCRVDEALYQAKHSGRNKVVSSGQAVLPLAINEEVKTGERILVEGVFHATKTEFGGGQLELFPVEIQGTLRNVISKFSKQVRDKGLILDRAFDAQLPLVLADPKRMALILTYLIDNAVKFTTRGGILIGATDRGGFLRIKVSDTGPGITSEDQTRIFNRFTRVDTSGHLPGAGMGLYLAKVWVEKMNGRIWVNSEPGKGSDFCLDFPVWKDEEFEDLL